MRPDALTAPARHQAAQPTSRDAQRPPPPSAPALRAAAGFSSGALLADLWREAVAIRREWLDVGLTTEPADRPAAEAAIASIYALHGRSRPTFVWVASPRAALPYLAGLPTHDTLRSWIGARPPAGRPPLASDIAAGLSRLRSALADGYVDPAPERSRMKRKKGEPWPELPPPEALRLGVPFLEVLRQGSLFRSLAEAVYLPIRAAVGEPLPVGWYGHQDASWVAHFDILRRLGLAHVGAAVVPPPAGRFDRDGATAERSGMALPLRSAGPLPAARPDHAMENDCPGVSAASSPGRLFAIWSALTRSAGWWWPDENRCVLVERPSVIRVEPVSHARHDEIRLSRSPGKPAIQYRDGWSL